MWRTGRLSRQVKPSCGRFFANMKSIFAVFILVDVGRVSLSFLSVGVKLFEVAQIKSCVG